MINSAPYQPSAALSANAQPQIEELRMPPEPGMPNRQTVRVSVANEHVFPTAESFHKLADSLGIENVSVSIGAPHFADYVTPPKNVWPVSIHFRPDLPYEKFSPVQLEKVNRFDQQIDAELQRNKIVDLGPQ
ncbi:hypothetical protein ACLE2W_24215 [Pseudomonas shahriarae]|jgi:hypothetical protein|uniref:hypothetical protein n=1 Tax=Pseudomonas TaxID=286 RepID=UPI0018E7E7D6|nr:MULTISPECIES: hypothetical protein [Pseudomonas]MDZ4300728.1 hypothetical protein [Pseudomonas sp.]MBJ2239539.1 hypothetical protein [Pseudomonas sp. MF6768]MBJ2251504.1 hypothetical protein [Pseudomonas sp. MF6784]MBU4627932.1 hypothetical protein [Pseudomonas sp. BF61]MCM8563199.1 hypothetical protein [Pseudomonas shahriarae]